MSNTGQMLYRRARKVMPGGTQLLSKRPEMFLPEQWPVYFKSAKGAEVVDLDELLVELHPWADMVRFGRAGGEAMAIAVRIARAATGRDMVAFCGYHGWHDWYLSANLGETTALDGHLLPGLDTKGVP